MPTKKTLKRKYRNYNSRWSVADVAQLNRRDWKSGLLASEMKMLVTNLGRTERAIRIKACRLGLTARDRG